jgi:hypothetical protein
VPYYCTAGTRMNDSSHDGAHRFGKYTSHDKDAINDACRRNEERARGCCSIVSS